MANRTSTPADSTSEGVQAGTETEENVPTVKYVGDAGVREITAKDWKAAGVEDQATVVWNEANEYTVLASTLNASALEIIKRDRNLKISS